MKEVFGFVLFVVFNLKKYLCQDRQLAQKVSSLEVSMLLTAAFSASETTEVYESPPVGAEQVFYTAPTHTDRIAKLALFKIAYPGISLPFACFLSYIHSLLHFLYVSPDNTFQELYSNL